MSTGEIARTIAGLIQSQGEQAARAREASGAVWGGALRDIGQTVQQTIATATDPKRQELQRQQAGRAALATAIKTTPPLPDGSPDHKAIAQKVSAGGFPDMAEAWTSQATKNAENFDKLDQFKRNAEKADQELEAHKKALVGDVAFNSKSYADAVAGVGLLASGKHPQIDEQSAHDLVDKMDAANAASPDGWKSVVTPYLQFSPTWLKQQEERNKPVVLPPTPRGGAPAQQVVGGNVVATGAPAPPDPAVAAAAARDAEIARHNKETERISGLTAGRQLAAEQETARHNRAMEAAANPFVGAPAGASGAAGPTGDDFLKTLAPAQQAQIKALAEGRQPFPTGMSYAKLQPLIAAVTQYDPTFDAANYTARSKARTDLTSPSGTGGKTINSLNTAVQHLGKLSDLIEALDNGDTPALNAVANWFSKETGSPKVTNFEAVQPQAMKEIERLWRGAGGSEGDIAALKSSLSTNMGKQQQREALNQFVELVKGKLDSTAQQRDNVLGAKVGASIPVLFPQNQSVLDKIAQRAAPKGANPASGSVTFDGFTFPNQAAADAYKKEVGK